MTQNDYFLWSLVMMGVVAIIAAAGPLLAFRMSNRAKRKEDWRREVINLCTDAQAALLIIERLAESYLHASLEADYFGELLAEVYQ